MDDKNNARKLGAVLAGFVATIICACVSVLVVAITIKLGIWIINL